MISTTNGMTLLTETMPAVQYATIDTLSEEDAKELLKIAVKLLRGDDVAA